MFDPLGVLIAYEIVQMQRVLLSAFCVLIAFRAGTLKTHGARAWGRLLAASTLTLALYLLLNAINNQTPVLPPPVKLWNVIPNICYVYTLFAIGGILSALERKKE